MKKETLSPNMAQGYHKVRGATIQNKRVEIGNSKFLDFLTDCRFEDCIIRINCGAQGINLFQSTFVNCVIWPARRMNNVRFTGLQFEICTFKGSYSGCRFGNEKLEDVSELTNCDFSQVKQLHLCDFLGDLHLQTCIWPQWPHIIITDMPAQADDWRGIDFPDEMRLVQKIVADGGPNTNAVSLYLPNETAAFASLKPLLESKPYILWV